LPNQIQTPSRIENREALLFLQPEISNVNVCSLNPIGNIGSSAGAGAKCQLRTALANVPETTVAALDERTIELRRFQNRARIIGAANIAWNHEWRRESVASRCVYMRS
jgi:hypothetical protein